MTPTAFETPAVAVLSGGNVDPLLLGKVIQHGMAAAGRFLYLRVVISDLPGGLAGLLADIGQVGASVIEVAHERISPHLNLNEVEVSLQLETAEPKHAAKLSAMLAEKGYRVNGWLAGVGHRVEDLDLDGLAVGRRVGRPCRRSCCR